MHSPKLSRILTLLLCFVFLPSIVSAKGLGLSPHRAQFAAPSFEQAPADETTSPVLAGKKNIGRAVMFSLVIPGTGQFYSGSWLRALPWLAVEVAGWALFSKYHADGNDKTDEFEKYAGDWPGNSSARNGNFNFDAYMMREYQVAANDLFAPVQYEGDYADWVDLDWVDRSPHLPAPYTHDITTNDRQQYYEMIGKYYEQFGYGWNDTYDPAGVNGGSTEHIWGPAFGNDIPATVAYDGTSSFFFHYRDMRGDANSLLEKGNTMMEIVLVNHVLSALDAAFAARSFNRKLEAANLGSMDLKYDIKHTREGDALRTLTLSIPLPAIR